MARARRARHRHYTVQTAQATYACMVCGGAIEAGDRYTRRRYKTSKGHYITLRKCSRCVPIRE